MASQQLARRENTTTEREIRVEKDTVPKMATHFEHLADHTGGKDTPQGSIEGERVREHAGKAVGDVGGRGKARETHELGAHFESLADKVKGGEDHKEKLSDHAANVVGNKESEREARGGVLDVGKFKMRTEGEDRGNKDREELETRTREVTGRASGGQLVADKGRARDEEKLRGRVGAENEGAKSTAVITCTLEQGNDTQKPREESESERSTGEQISNYRDQATQSLKERYERAKQAASETLSNTAQTATQAKDATLEKGQQGYAATKDTISGAAKTASEKTAPVAEKAKGYTLEAAEKAKGYTLEAAEKAKSAGGTTASYVGEKAVQAKDVSVESGKSAAGYAAKVAADLKDKAAVAGWAVAHFSAEKTVEGTKAAAHVVEGAAGYAGQKAAELASKSAGAVKGLAASAGETAKEYTARKKEEALRELEAKKASQPQEAEERPSQGIGETVSQYAQKVKPSGGGNSQQEGTGSSVLTAIGDTVSNVGGKVKKPFENIGEKLGDAKQRKELLDNVTGNITEGGGEVLGAVGETVGEIGESMLKPAERVQERAQVRQEGGVLDAIGETIAEIAETTRVMVAGEDEGVLRQSVVSETRATDRANHEGSKSA